MSAGPMVVPHTLRTHAQDMIKHAFFTEEQKIIVKWLKAPAE